MIRFETDTTEYESSHGKQPRGRGNWGVKASVHVPGAFCDMPPRFSGPNVPLSKFVADLKREVRSEWNGTGVRECVIEVLP